MPVIFDAVKTYVVVTVGAKITEVEPSTEPIPLSILKVVGAPPESIHDNVTEFP